MNAFETLAHPSKLWGVHQDNARVLRDNPRRLAPDLMRIFLANKIPLTTWGPPGSRKTRYIESLSQEVDANGVPFQVVTIQPSTSDPTVIHGMYYTARPEGGGETIMLRSVPEIAQRIYDYHENTGGVTNVLLDEITTCSSAQQNSMLGMLTHGQFGSINISHCTAFIMAANPEGTVSTVNPLSEAVMNRGGHIAWYGDAQLFLEEWGNGFGIESLRPQELTKWYIDTLIGDSVDDAFRDENWSVEELVPYDSFLHSERTTTDLATIITYINTHFKPYPQDIRHHYIIKATEALQGPKWANRMTAVCAQESSLVSSQDLKDMVAEHGLNSLSGSVGALQGKMFLAETVDGVQQRLPQDTISELATKLCNEFIQNDDRLAYLTLWAFIATAPSSGIAALINPVGLNALIQATNKARAGNMDRQDVMPVFVSAETREAIKVLKSAL